MEDIQGDTTNKCYEALLDLRSIFPAWSETQDNFYYHWKQILNSTTKFEDSENEVLKFYVKTLKPLIISNGSGIDSETALRLVQQMDDYRKQKDEQFQSYELESILNRDTSSIKSKPKQLKMTTLKSAPASQNIETEGASNHIYGTRTNSKRLLHRKSNSSDGNKLDYNIVSIGTHLKRGFFSNYVWDFMIPTEKGSKAESVKKSR